MPLVDSHCHLDFEDFREDLPAILERARAAGIVAMVCVGSGGDVATAERAAALAVKEPDVYAAIGMHPHDAGKVEPDHWPALAKLARAPRVVGIGETGLDYFYDHSPRQVQREIFEGFLRLAIAADRPVICHVRDAHEDALAVLGAGPLPGAGGVIHCFSGNRDHARCYLDLGFHLSFSGVLTFKKADDIRSAAAYAPVDRILVETDAPYLAPIPHRGKRNEPAYVVHTLEALARVRGISPSRAAELTTANAFRLFNLSLPQPQPSA
ncbi:MAG: TatD family hydrolase [Deltaproteobacteria bacterium]|nr:TatD family hydrolase [Deltaproteobacteria bacterium]